MSIREKFVARFGEKAAIAMESAAEYHKADILEVSKGSDPFKWVLLVCIGRQCAEKSSYREHHNITTPWADLKQWMIDNADLGSFDGTCPDYLSLFAGAYNDFAKTPSSSVGRQKEEGIA